MGLSIGSGSGRFTLSGYSQASTIRLTARGPSLTAYHHSPPLMPWSPFGSCWQSRPPGPQLKPGPVPLSRFIIA